MGKREQLIARLAAQPEPQLVPIAEFLDGNEDLGSIGCNLEVHPGLDVFREVLDRVASRPDVEAVYAQIAELDPGDDCWPFADTVLVAGTIAPAALEELVAPLQPDEVSQLPSSAVPAELQARHRTPLLQVWWD